MKALYAFIPFAAIATALPLVESRLVIEKLVGGRAVTVTEEDISNFRFYAEFAGAGYCNSEKAVGSPVTCDSNVCPTVTGDKATVVGALNGDTATNIDGFVATDPARSLIVVSFRGSRSVRNWLANIVFPQTPCDLVTGCLVHTGFASAWKAVKADVLAAVKAATAAHPSYELVVTGHSLGGAVGTLAAAYLRTAGYACDLYTYGSPRVGNEAFAQFVTAQQGAEYRVTHLDDPVPRLPPILLNYRHTSPEYWLHTGTATTNNYGAADVKVCEGTANTKCNAGTTALDADAHGHYFVNITACGSDDDDTIIWRRDGAEDAAVGDEELDERLGMFARLDQAYAAALESGG